MSELLLVPIVFVTSCLAAVMGMGGGMLLIAMMPGIPGGGQLSLALLGFFQTGLGMVAGATGPVGAAVLLRRNSGRDWLVVNTAVYMTLNHTIRLAAFLAIGFSFAPWWKLLSAMVLAGILGSWVGTQLRSFVLPLDFQRLFRWLVTLLAARMIALPILSLF